VSAGAATPVVACVALGSNLGDPRAQVLRAFEELAVLPGTRLAARSRLWRTRPVGPPQPDFVNAAARLETGLDPHDLFARLLAIEAAHGRTRGERWGPRTLDLDLLLYGTLSFATPGLTVPHPGLVDRAFVLLPLAEVAGDLEVPGHGRVADLAAACGRDGVASEPELGSPWGL
jgi:2-amino-4-hydroxy-6-hydroxymethyldihydropteridine diphosphokinase